MKDALEMRLEVRVPSSHNILAWMVEFAATLVNRYEVGRDGRTPHERLRGKASRLIGLEFGERLNFRRTAVGSRMAKLDSLWSDGVFLGYRAVSGEIVVGTKDGVFKTRTVKRKPLEHRWDKQNLGMVGGVPWRTSPDQDEGEEVMPAIDIGMEMPEVEIPKPPAGDKQPIPRRLYIKARDIERYGATENCKGCVATLRGQGGVAHSDSCRRRLTEEIEKGEDGGRAKRARQREMEFYEQAIRNSVEEGKRKAEDTEEDLAKKTKVSDDSAGGTGSAGSSSGGLVRTETDDDDMQGLAEGGFRGQKRGAEDPPEDQDRGDGDGVAVEGVSHLQELRVDERDFGEYHRDGGLWMVACREPDEDLQQVPEDNLSAGGGGSDGDDTGEEVVFRDDRTGKPLDTAKVRAAREEELRELDRRVWEEADVQECWEKKGRRPIGVRWVDVDKGFGVHRSRLVAKDFKPKSKINDKEGLFAATPPLELVKMLIVRAARCGKRGKETRKVMFVDISKAHLYAPVQEEEFVELPPERSKDGKCARLIYTLYGMRTAASNWEKEYSKTLEEAGFQPGKATVVAFFNKERDIRIVVHGDDFVIEGRESDLEWMRDVLAAKYLIKVRGVLGPTARDQKTIVILGRVVEWRVDELWWEADPRHVEKILDACGMKDGNASVVPGVKLQEEAGDEEELAGEDLTRYRSVAARANFIAQDRPDIRFAVKELCRDMCKPTVASMRKLKKLARYLRGQPRMVQKIRLQDQGIENEITIIVDSDWAGCTSTRRSTNGGCIMVGDVCLKAWSTTQGVVALSSGEAEYYAAVKGASEGLGFQAACADLGMWEERPVAVKVLTDSSACKGICQRTGLGKIRHIDVALLWLQDMVRRGKISMRKIPGDSNPADLMTKYLTGNKTAEVSLNLGFYSEDGRTNIVDEA